MGRTPLFGALRRALAVAGAAARPGAPPPDELAGIERPSRRAVLGGMGAAALASWLPQRGFAQGQAGAPTVAVVGAGMAGLAATWRLAEAGVPVTLYDAARRTGGRIFSREGVVAPGLVTELGAELINTDHRDMLAFVRLFELPLIDLHTAQTGPAVEERFFAGGAARTEAQVVAALMPYMRRIAADRAALENNPRRKAALDRMSLAQYLGALGMTGWVRSLMLRAFGAEMGADPDRQTALYFIATLHTDPVLNLFLSDERYSVLGGNQRVPDALAERLRERTRLEHRLESVRRTGARLRLTFDGPNSASVEVDCDAAILAVPFTTLRRVDLRIDLPAAQRRAIRTLQYGTNAKLFAGVRRRVWQGALLSDLPFDQAWDSHRNRPGEMGALTMFAGGAAGVGFRRPANDLVAEFAPRLREAVPALREEGLFTGTAARFDWPGNPLVMGSYSCFAPGQSTEFGEVLARPAGNLFFAGEHTSSGFQGYMEGGAESGRVAAEALLAQAGARRAG